MNGWRSQARGMGLADCLKSNESREGRLMYKRIMKYGKWFAILYVAQAMVGVGIGLYSVWSGSTVFGLDLTP